jgi:uncharacterized protein YbcV (DUF1398 family)
MDSKQQNLIRETFSASNEGRVHFGDVVARLTEASVESYAVDYRSHSATYHLANDETLSLRMEATPVDIGKVFAAEALREAIREAQKGVVMYPEFKRRSMQAGCVGYTVWIAGRHVTYFGRKGEAHVERFPS